jgi:hypothetical protein
MREGEDGIKVYRMGEGGEGLMEEDRKEIIFPEKPNLSMH